MEFVSFLNNNKKKSPSPNWREHEQTVPGSAWYWFVSLASKLLGSTVMRIAYTPKKIKKMDIG